MSTAEQEAPNPSLVPYTAMRRSLVPELGPNVWLVYSGMFSADGAEICFYEALPDGAPGTVLNDACAFLRSAELAGVALKPAFLENLVHTYKLKLSSPDLCLFDDTQEPVGTRYVRFAQCLAALDGVLRMWATSAPVRT